MDNKRYIDVKVRRGYMNDDLKTQVTEKTKDYIVKMKEDNGMNFVYYNHPRAKTIKEAMTSDSQYVVGRVTGIDDEFVYCELFKDKIDDINLDKIEADINYLVEYPYGGEKRVFEITRVNLIDFE